MDFPIQSPQHAVRHNVIIQLNPFTVFIHVHFQALFQTARSALVSVSLVDRTTTLDRHREGEREVVRAFSCIPLSLSDKVFLLLSSWEAAPGERSAYYHRVIELLPCSSVAGSSGRISVLSRPPPQKSSPSNHHIRLDYICCITAVPRFSAALNSRRVTKLRSSRGTWHPRQEDRSK